MADKEVLIPEEIAEKLEKKAKESGFDSLNDYILFVLKQIVPESEKSSESQEEQMRRKRLEDLGYL